MKGFDKRTAAFYNSIRKNKSSLNDYVEFPAMKKLLPTVKGKKVLDVGCGTGEMSIYLAKKGAQVSAVEASAEMLVYCTQHKNIKYYNVTAENMSFKKEYFDIIISELIIDHLKNIKKVLKKLHYSLKKKGELLISIPHPFRKTFKKKSWTDVRNPKLVGYFNERRVVSDWE